MTIDRRFIHLNSTASTNNDLKARIAAADGPVWDVISAKTQTGGRGRLGRSFFSPPGGLYFSAALPLKGTETNIPCLTLAAGLCVCTALEEACGIAPRIKWPNDVYLNGKKLCGILCELVTGRTPAAVVGAGVNLTVQKSGIPEELQDKMTSLRAEGVSAPAPDALVRSIVEKLDKAVYVDRILSDASAAANYMEQVSARSLLTGKTVSFAADGQSLSGVFTGVSPTGAALIRLPDGTTRAVVSGEITVGQKSG
ncbi:MAG: biotin--[Clostridia bacterium]|nr:biotin--[acetyl-CoA-carboxylase] ligase [Clostridia bacterium]